MTLDPILCGCTQRFRENLLLLLQTVTFKGHSSSSHRLPRLRNSGFITLISKVSNYPCSPLKMNLPGFLSFPLEALQLPIQAPLAISPALYLSHFFLQTSLILDMAKESSV